MAIPFVPVQGMVLMCNFETGFVPPEMTKTRHVVVVSLLHSRDTGSCLVVPISTQAPGRVQPYHFRIPANKYSFFKVNTDVWAKADTLSHVSFGRLDRVLDGKKWCSPSLIPSDFKGVQASVLQALGCPIVSSQVIETKGIVTSVVESPKIVLDAIDQSG